MTDSNAFDGFISWVQMLNFLIVNKISKYEVKPGITNVEIVGNTIFIPPHLEQIVSKLLEEKTQNEQHI